MRKQPLNTSVFSSIIKKFIGGAIVLELAAFGVGYLGFNRVNNSRDTRLYLRDNYPVILNCYYTIGERLNSKDQVRALDTEEWTRLGK
ncbi:unnamed protein product [Allacma fusca]|uniref:Uncharacterized protein n=1 Tax=Allacma fusca TaxID=39272 RepID=A0A8J2KYD8_9HEXA|nr:unnamed protein product [Allacma fusca]